MCRFVCVPYSLQMHLERLVLMPIWTFIYLKYPNIKTYFYVHIKKVCNNAKGISIRSLDCIPFQTCLNVHVDKVTHQCACIYRFGLDSHKCIHMCVWGKGCHPYVCICKFIDVDNDGVTFEYSICMQVVKRVS